MNEKPQPVRPIVPTGIVTEFGELLDDPETLAAEAGQNFDLTYVPGFSDMRREYDLTLGKGEKPKPLPVNMRWGRRTQVSGTPTNAKLVWHKNQGYRPVMWDEIGTTPWLTDAPAGAIKLPDGSIGMADSQLLVCDQKSAARNAYQKQVKWMAANSDARDAKLRVAGEKVPGSNPVVTVDTSPRPAA